MTRTKPDVGVGESDGSVRPIEELPSALDAIEAIVEEIGPREPVFFLDFDGTLAPIVSRPGDARLPESMRRQLRELARRRRVAIVSGRDLDDLRERVEIEEIYYAGSHGFRLAGPDGWHREHEQARRFLPALDAAEKALEERLAEIPGAEVERKRYAVAVHYRRVREQDAERVRAAVEAMRSERDSERDEELRLSEGRKVLELRPDIDWDKGRALVWLLEAIGTPRAEAFPIYVGDDVTDEDAFREIGADGLGVVVRGRGGTTRARYALADTDAVRKLLARIDAEASRS